MRHDFSIGLLAIIAVTPCANAQDPSADAVGKWLNDRVMSAAMADDRLGAMAANSEGTYRVVSLEDLDAPEAVKAQFRAELRQRRGNGVVRVSGGTIPSISELLAGLPTKQRSAGELRQRLPSAPSHLRGTALAGAEVIGMEPSGALDGIRSSGLTRYFRVKDLGIVSFNEENFRASGMTVETFAEAQNVVVNGEPAQLDLYEDDQGRAQAILAWASDGKALRLTATGSGDAAQKGRAILSIASGIVD